jgi:hypothetical protein
VDTVMLGAPVTSGGAHTSRTMMLRELRDLLRAVAPHAPAEEYRQAVVDRNVLAKASDSARRRSFRYLRELYDLDPASPTFHALRVLWDLDNEAQPLMALASSLARDAALRGTADALLTAPEGAPVTAGVLAGAVQAAYPDSYGDAVANKIGRNAASTWTQSGHLTGRTPKIRVRANPRPASVAYALYLASLGGRQGDLLFEALPVYAQDAPTYALKELAREASRRGWLDYRSIGTVTEVGFSHLDRREDLGV